MPKTLTREYLANMPGSLQHYFERKGYAHQVHMLFALGDFDALIAVLAQNDKDEWLYAAVGTVENFEEFEMECSRKMAAEIYKGFVDYTRTHMGCTVVKIEPAA